jgi:TolA-binding protein
MQQGGIVTMKKLVVVVLLAVLALSGCASGSFLGLATTQYVDDKSKAALDQQAADMEKLKAEQEAQIKELQAKIADYESMKEQAMAAIDAMNQTKQTIADLQGLAKRAEDRISTIPREVIKQIVDILQSSLGQ